MTTVGGRDGTYGVVDVRTNDEAFATAVIAMLDSDDITGLL
jgi:hypothetical protein